MSNGDAFSRERDARLRSAVVAAATITVRDYYEPNAGNARHPYLATHPYVIAMEAADSLLSDTIVKERALPDWKVKAVVAARDIAFALSQLHSVGRIHGDLKPVNIVRASGSYTLFDLDASADISSPYARQVSYAFTPPRSARAFTAARRGAHI
jgi:serine/threonine protein kinase